MNHFNLFLILSIVFAFPAALSADPYGGGNGEPDAPYVISETAHLDYMHYHSEDYDKCFIVCADINMSSYSYATAVIAPDTDNSNSDFDGAAFTGVFDGNDKKITGLTIDESGAGNDFLGLFGKLEAGAVVKNLGIEGGSVAASNGSIYVGCLVGRNDSSVVSNCYATGTIISEGDYVGGLAGYSERYSIISSCYSAAAVSGDDYIGGLAGHDEYCCNIVNCYATGEVIGDRFVGGLAGRNMSGIISNCYATGQVTGNMFVGGLFGMNGGGAVSNCFWDVETTGIADPEAGMPDTDGMTGKTTAEMQDENTFLDAGWDFVTETANGTCQLWFMPTGQYPQLHYFDSSFSPYQFAGSGTEYDPYLVNDANDLGAVRQYPDKYYSQINDINVSDIRWSTAAVCYFAGSFNGNNSTISNMQMAGAGRLGLFGMVISEGSAKNLGIEGGSVSGSSELSYHIGNLAGLNSGSITNCYTTGTVSANSRSGGLVGENYSQGVISNCRAMGSVGGKQFIGGLAGCNRDQGAISESCAAGNVNGGYTSESLGGLTGENYGSISKCYATGTVNGDLESGGLAGENYGSISECYATGTVTGTGAIGGLAGVNYSGGGISNCYAAGAVNGDDEIGGLLGVNFDGAISGCFWDIETSGTGDGVGNEEPDPPGVSGKSTAEMQDPNTFLDEGWDFREETANGTEDIWTLCSREPHYPRLLWQMPAGDFVCLDGVDFTDFAAFALAWLTVEGQIRYNPDCDISFPADNSIDMNDLAVFVESWLAGI